MCGGRWFWPSPRRGVGIVRTRIARHSSANGRACRIEDRRNRWASEAIQDSRGRPLRPGTTPADRYSWADNLALLEDWRQAFAEEAASLYLVPTALRWIPLFCKAHVRRLFHRLDRWIVRRFWSHRFKLWRNAGWKRLPERRLYGAFGLVKLIALIPSLNLR